MGEVYRARDTRPELAREVAIKTLAGVAADPERRRRFELEARATGALNHPNILAIYDVGAHDDTLYLVEELLDGTTLRAPLDLGTPQPLFTTRLRPSSALDQYVVTADSQRFIVMEPPVDAPLDALIIVTNWTTLLTK